jgi:cephalosporin-C deacetylase-like acetyl esterase
MPKPSITEQREAVESLINCALQDEVCPPSDVEAAKQAVLTLQYLEVNPELYRVVAAVIKTFEAEVVGVD